MPKSDKGIWRVKESVILSEECRTFLVVIPPSFMGEKDDSISMESWRSPSETEEERGCSLHAIICSSFFDGLICRKLCPKKCLTTSKTVMCMRGGGGGGGRL